MVFLALYEGPLEHETPVALLCPLAVASFMALWPIPGAV